MNQFPNPLQINLGNGRIEITQYSDIDGYGVLLKDTGEDHVIGRATGTREELVSWEHSPQSGEIYIHCANRESALVLMEQVCRVVAAFSNPNADS